MPENGNGKVENISLLEIRVLEDVEGGPDRYGVFENGKLKADCSKPQTAVNSLTEILKGNLNGIYPAKVPVSGTRQKAWKVVEKVKKAPEYNTVSVDDLLAGEPNAKTA